MLKSLKASVHGYGWISFENMSKNNCLSLLQPGCQVFHSDICSCHSSIMFLLNMSLFWKYFRNCSKIQRVLKSTFRVKKFWQHEIEILTYNKVMTCQFQYKIVFIQQFSSISQELRKFISSGRCFGCFRRGASDRKLR
jgi:hypothetical protein